MMKFKKDEKVTIKSWNKMIQEGILINEDEVFISFNNKSVFFSEAMKSLCDKEYIISYVGDNHYKIVGYDNVFIDEMFVGGEKTTKETTKEMIDEAFDEAMYLNKI